MSRIRPALLLILMGLFQALSCPAQSGSARGWYQRGRSALEADDPYTAIDSFREAMRLNPAYADARLGMAESLYLLGEYSKAYDEIDDARPFTVGDRRRILIEARILTALRRYDESKALYNGILNHRPHDPQANRGLAEIYVILGQRELAEEKYAGTLQYSPGNLRVLLQLNLLHNRYGEKNTAENALLEALRLYPDNIHVHIQAAEHYALYNEWDMASLHFESAMAMLEGPDDRRYRKIAALDASLQLRRGDPAAALKILQSLPADDEPELLLLNARAQRQLGNEEMAQQVLRLLLKLNPEDEIIRIFKETPLVQSISGFEKFRNESASWHLEKGMRQQQAFYFDQALSSYRRARRINSTNAEIWLKYANIIRLKGYPLKYRDELDAAVFELENNPQQQAIVRKRLELYRHSEGGNLGDTWNIPEPWSLNSEAWNVAVFSIRDERELINHEGTGLDIASYFADLLDSRPKVYVHNFDGGLFPAAKASDSYIEAFRKARNTVDYFVLLSFSETERSFSAEATVYFGRDGQEFLRISQDRSGKERVFDTLSILASDLAAGLPNKLSIINIDGERVLLDKGRWHGMTMGETLIVLRQGSARPAGTESGIEYPESDFLGTLEITGISESLSEGVFRRAGDFEFLSLGDEAYAAPVPMDLPDSPLPDPAFRSRLLAIP